MPWQLRLILYSACLLAGMYVGVNYGPRLLAVEQPVAADIVIVTPQPATGWWYIPYPTYTWTETLIGHGRTETGPVMTVPARLWGSFVGGVSGIVVGAGVDLLIMRRKAFKKPAVQDAGCGSAARQSSVLNSKGDPRSP